MRPDTAAAFPEAMLRDPDPYVRALCALATRNPLPGVALTVAVAQYAFMRWALRAFGEDARAS